ncbi:response regulator transcription factor [Nostocoides sp. Soil756]|jgi:DNA-binding NarL/FixJ family response regulator|uniref:response regulator n=1 Tax=Nostocoides sp. Soil756 TaxID=1736399 RepID=UPI0007015C52|nr:response regulator transcription factor [Tetrasphaera sp. Soil756]KRE63548.1 LuxR family transcriptional regulator [Tetrasphaera sp. Soil756]
MTDTEPIRVVIADDQALVRAGFRLILESEPGLAVVGEADDGAHALAVCAAQDPDVVLMDLRMPEVDGLEATRRLQASHSRAKVLALTTFDTERYVYEALRAGASGFLLKTAPPDRLVAAVRQVHAGEALLAPSITRRLIEDYVRRPGPGPARTAGPLAHLTERETEVLRLVARGLSNAEIAERLFLGETTVKTHINRLLAKLPARDRVQAAIAAYEHGLVRPGDPRED